MRSWSQSEKLFLFSLNKRLILTVLANQTHGICRNRKILILPGTYHWTEITTFLHRMSHFKAQISPQRQWISRPCDDNCMAITVVFRKSVQGKKGSKSVWVLFFGPSSCDNLVILKAWGLNPTFTGILHSFTNQEFLSLT